MPQVIVEPRIVDPVVGAIGRNRLLGALPPADFTFLAPHLVETMLQPGAVLAEPGQRIKRVTFPHGGLVSLLGVLPEGNAVDTATIGREGAIGLSAGLGAQLAVSRAVVQLPGAAAQISPALLAEAVAQSKAVRDMIVRYCDTLLAQVQQSVVCNTVHHVQERLCRWLLHAHDRIEDDTIPLTQEFLSGLLGVQRTTITAICRMLQAEGIVDVRRGRISIRNLGALTRKSCACYGIAIRLNERPSAGMFARHLDDGHRAR
jgi:CRP-like cAMP-binding protein